MTTIKQFNKARNMVKAKRAAPITIAGLKRVQVQKPRVVKSTGKRGGTMKIR
jgi:hypothetical protein